jgi:two-component system cell cycle response regulator
MCAQILVIEDNEANLELITYLLNSFGHSTIFAYDGEKGLELATHEPIDLIICDIELPRVNGYEIARQLKSHPILYQIPLIAVTAFAMMYDRDKALQVGFDGFITKPIEPENFVEQIEVFLTADLIPKRLPPVEHPVGDQIPFQSALKDITILIVDNTRANLLLMQGILEPHGYRVIVTLEVDEALKLAREAPPDLIISDLHMPISGYDFLRSVKSETKLSKIPFIIVSSTMLVTEDAGRALSLGAISFLSRPIEPQTLIEEVEACLR